MKLLIFQSAFSQDQKKRREDLKEDAESAGSSAVICEFLPEPTDDFDLLLCHLADLSSQVAKDKVCGLASANKNVVLYSGGGITATESGGIVTAKVNDGNSELKFSAGLKEHIHVVPSAVFGPEQLPVGMALRASATEAGADQSQQVLINTLLSFDPKLEASLNFLYACLIGGDVSEDAWSLIKETQIPEAGCELGKYIKPERMTDKCVYFLQVGPEALQIARSALLYQ